MGMLYEYEGMYDVEYDMKRYFEYLKSLRDSGVTNMFGATPYLEAEFGMSKKQAVFVLSRWMESFRK
jgi:hypothetical protein